MPSGQTRHRAGHCLAGGWAPRQAAPLSSAPPQPAACLACPTAGESHTDSFGQTYRCLAQVLVGPSPQPMAALSLGLLPCWEKQGLTSSVAVTGFHIWCWGDVVRWGNKRTRESIPRNISLIQPGFSF